MASKEAIVAANYLADRYVVGSNMVGLFRKQEPDYAGYVHDMAPLLFCHIVFLQVGYHREVVSFLHEEL